MTHSSNKAKAAKGQTIDLSVYESQHPGMLDELGQFQANRPDWRRHLQGCHDGRFPSGMSSDLFGFIRVIRNHVTADVNVIPDLNEEPDADSFPVNLLVQGGHWREGRAVGRKGKQILAIYKIQSGEPRQRWFTPDRYQMGAQFNLDQLPKWKTIVCAMLMFPQPRPLDSIDQTDRVCRHCKGEHDYVWGRRENDRTMVIGMKSRRSVVLDKPAEPKRDEGYCTSCRKWISMEGGELNKHGRMAMNSQPMWCQGSGRRVKRTR